MKSRTFYFNGAVLKKNLQRCLPLLIVYTVFWTLLLSTSYDSTLNQIAITNQILRLGNTVGNICNLGYGLALSMVIYSYLFNARSANMIHALPLRREGLFLSNLVSGLLCSLAPNLLIMLLTLAANRGMGGQALLQWFAMMTLQFVFYFGFASFLAQLTGHLIALPVFYLILNFAVVVLETLIKLLLRSCVFGLSFTGSLLLDFLSPTFYLLESGIVRDGLFNQWIYLLLLAACGALFLLFALLLYRKRKIEAAGDVIAIQALRPIFKYCFTFGCAVVLGYLILCILNIDVCYGTALPVILCMLCGAFFGYFGSEMALEKKINVFQRQWIGFGIFTVCLVLTFGLCWIDAFGYSAYQPERDEIAGVCLDERNTAIGYTQDADVIDAVYALHNEIIQERPCLQGDSWSSTFSVRYLLKNGKTVTREYALYMTNDPQSENYAFSMRFDEIYNRTELLLLRNCPTEPVTRTNVYSASLEYQDMDGDYKHIDLTSDELVWLYENCLVPDILDGTVVVEHLYHYATTDTVPDSTTITGITDGPEWFSLCFDFNSETSGRFHYYYYYITPDATRTFSAACDFASNSTEP